MSTSRIYIIGVGAISGYHIEVVKKFWGDPLYLPIHLQHGYSIKLSLSGQKK